MGLTDSYPNIIGQILDFAATFEFEGHSHAR